MRKLATNNVWSKYSMKGRKGKLPLKDLPVCRLILSMYLCIAFKVYCDKQNFEMLACTVAVAACDSAPQCGLVLMANNCQAAR